MRVLGAALVAALAVSVPASAQDVRLGKRNPSSGSVTTPTRIACRSSPASRPCLGLRNAGRAPAFTFSTGGVLGGTITVGRGGPDARPFTTNATGVATGLNADAVDGLSADQIIHAAVEQANLRPLPRLGDAETLDGRDSTSFLAANGVAADAARLGGLTAAAFLRADGKAADADRLDGRTATDFLAADGVAADAAKLGGLAESAFLRTTGKAADADKIDGLEPSAFLGATAKAADADAVDGVDGAALAREASFVRSAGRIDLGTSGVAQVVDLGDVTIAALCTAPGGVRTLTLRAASGVDDTWVAASSPGNAPPAVEVDEGSGGAVVYTADEGGSGALTNVDVSVSFDDGTMATGVLAVGFGIHGAACSIGGTLDRTEAP